MTATAEVGLGTRHPRTTMVAVAVALMALGGGLGWWTSVQAGPLPVDLWWDSTVSGDRVPALLDASLVLDWLGAGVVGVYVIPLGAATLAVVALLLYPAFWVRVVGVVTVTLMALSRTYLHAHWLSDTVGGVLIGSAVAILLAAAFWGPIAQERHDGSVTPCAARPGPGRPPSRRGWARQWSRTGGRRAGSAPASGRWSSAPRGS